MLPSKEDLKSFPVFAPLLAAVFAPLSTLIDIPALTEPWFFHSTSNGLQKLPDPHPNIALSGIGLFFNVVANGLLIARFSTSERWWRIATRLSMACWILKFCIALANVLAYGILTRNEPDINYGEGFWCAVVSLVVSLAILLFLLCHFIFQFLPNQSKTSPSVRQLQVRIAGRQFMLQTQYFVGTIGILSLYMSRLEKWTFVQGIYFSVVTFLTIGFGDFYPTKPATQIVLFPFVLVGIVQLASLIDMIVRFFSSRVASHHAQERTKFEQKREEEENRLEQEPDLERELIFLKRIYSSVGKKKKTEDIVLSIVGFLTFWVIGALIFSQTESWTYGQGLYFCYIFFFSIGYGDYTPISPAGRVIFIVYSLVAVPVMASFAVQTIQNVLKSTLADRLRRKRADAGLDVEFNVRDGKLHYGKDGGQDKASSTSPSEETTRDGGMVETARKEGESKQLQESEQLPEDAQKRIEDSLRDWNKPHAYYIARSHKRIEEKLALASRSHSKVRLDEGNNGEVKIPPNAAAEVEKDADADAEDRRSLEFAERDVDRVLTEYVLELAVELEKHARRLLLAHMEEGSNARMLLKADRIVQLRNIRALARKEVDGTNPTSEGENGNGQLANGERKRPINALMRKYYEEEAELLPAPTDLDERETLDEVTRYRESFAGLLAAGSRLLGLKDEEKRLFERRMKEIEVGNDEATKSS